MKVLSDTNNVIFLKGDSQYDLASTFMRMQEFYESPKFKGEVFDLEDYMDWYAAKYGNFTYTSDWNGFNVPGNVVDDFFKKFGDQLLRKEEYLYNLLSGCVGQHFNYYVIGVHDDKNAMMHEHAHAFYYLNQQYKQEQDALVKKLPAKFRNSVYKWLETSGYHADVFVDECQAYLSTNTMTETAEDFGEDAPWDTILKMQQTFEKYYDEHTEEDKSE